MKKTKSKPTNYKKALERMERETNRAIAHVQLLQKLYQETVKQNAKK